jgi:hypothetical protein
MPSPIILFSFHAFSYYFSFRAFSYYSFHSMPSPTTLSILCLLLLLFSFRALSYCAYFHSAHPPTTLKGTQDWEFFWLLFWNLHYFFVSYVKILRFYQKNFLIGPFLGEVRFFRVVLGLRGMKKNFELGQKFFFFSSIMGPKYDPILVFENSVN